MKRFTRKHAKYHKNDQYINVTERYNTILNRIDVEKDAIHTDTPVKRGLHYFHLVANHLFGHLVKGSYTQSLDYITHILSSYESSDKHELTVRTYDKIISYDFLSNMIQFGIQDAGMAPKSYIPTIRNVITPGSYIDSGSRSSEGIRFGFGVTLRNKNFKLLGMPMIESLFVSNLDTYNECTIELKINNISSSTTATFNNKFKAYKGNIEYFKGNDTKNKYFNTGVSDYTTSINHIICKELGDTLQALYSKLLAEQIEHGDKRVCLFTNDTILTLRCKLMGLQVVLNIPHGNSLKTIYYYPVMSDVVLDFMKLWQSNTIANNELIVRDIDSVLNKKMYFTVSGKRINFNVDDSIYSLIVKFKNYAIEKNNAFKLINYHDMSPDTYNKLALMYDVPHFFINNVLNNAILRLVFSNYEQNILLGGSSQTETMVGGGGVVEEMMPFAFKEEDRDYTIDRVYDDTDRPAVRTKRTLYLIYLKKYPEKTKNELCYICEGISLILYYYFTYMGESTWRHEFLQRIVDQYEAGILGTQSFEDFEREYKEWAYKGEEDELKKIRSKYMYTNTYIPTMSNSLLPIAVIGGRRKTRKRVKK